MLLFRDLNGIIAIDFKEKEEPKIFKKIHIYIHTHIHTHYIYIYFEWIKTHNDHF